jgi:hypothetical protein
MSSIVWLASYPKSGNTWLRAFLANYLANAAAPVDINAFAQYSLADNALRPYRELSGRDKPSDSDINRLRPRVHAGYAAAGPGVVLVKTHNAIARLDGVPTITPELTSGALYVIRHPCDVAISFADHYGISIDAAIRTLNSDTAATMPGDKVTFQFLSSWSQHVTGWTQAKGLRVHLLRYEDMSAKATETFASVVRFLKLPEDSERLARAIRFSAFDVLREQEAQHGYSEGSRKAERFFREGKSGNWRTLLSAAQQNEIITRHRAVMAMHGYVDASASAAS